MLQGSADVLTQVVLPLLLNELATSDDDLALLLAGYHLISSPTCHQTLGFFVDHLPANVHVVLSTRADPPLQLARLRASGELTELRIADLEFTDAEAASLLQDGMGLDLTPQAVQRLWDRTEGWAAGLVLAGLSLRDRTDPEPFIASSLLAPPAPYWARTGRVWSSPSERPSLVRLTGSTMPPPPTRGGAPWSPAASATWSSGTTSPLRRVRDRPRGQILPRGRPGQQAARGLRDLRRRLPGPPGRRPAPGRAGRGRRR